MTQELLPPELDRPRWEWWGNIWGSVVQVVLAFLVFFFPNLVGIDESLQPLRLIIGIPILLLPILGPTLLWLFKAGVVTYKRARYYPTLRHRTRRDEDDLARANQTIFAFLQNATSGQVYALDRAWYDRNTDQLFIVLEKNGTHDLTRGDSVAVLHTSGTRYMGLFEVTEVRAQEYYARGVTNVDPLWMGQMREQIEVRVLPFMIAEYLPAQGLGGHR